MHLDPYVVENWPEYYFNRNWHLLMLKREGEEYQEEIRKLKGP